MSHNPENYFWPCVLDLKDGTVLPFSTHSSSQSCAALSTRHAQKAAHHFSATTSITRQAKVIPPLCSFSTIFPLQSPLLNTVCSARDEQHCREAIKVQWFQYFPILQKHLSCLILFRTIFALL